MVDQDGSDKRRIQRGVIRGRILKHLEKRPGWHSLGCIREDDRILRRLDPAMLWPELRVLADRGRIVVASATVIQPCYGFEFISTMPVFSHWRNLAPPPPPAAYRAPDPYGECGGTADHG